MNPASISLLSWFYKFNSASTSTFRF